MTAVDISVDELLRRDWAARIASAWSKTVQGLLEAGRLIAEAKAILPHGEFLAMVERDLRFGKRTAQMLMKVGADERFAKHASLLPPSWTTLLELTKLPDERFEAMLASGEIHPEMERKHAVSETRRIARASAENRITLYTNKGEPIDHPRPERPVFNRTEGEGISWAEWSWNPVTGCEHDCAYCYAREIAERFYPSKFKPIFRPERLACPVNTPVPSGDDPAMRRVFLVSMGDLYGNWVPNDWIDQTHQAMRENLQWQYITLTKNPARYVVKPPPPGAWSAAQWTGRRWSA